MKLFIFMSLFTSLISVAGEVRDFNKALLQEVNKQVKDETNNPFKKKEVTRGPASVGSAEVEPRIQEESKIEKSNIKQIGPNKW